MGLIVGRWRFPDPAPPSLGEVGRALQDATGLIVRDGDDGALDIPLLRQTLLDMAIEGDVLTLSGFIPAHPYLWENLDAVMTALGGVREPDPVAWQPNPGDLALRRPWAALARRDRWLLRLPPLLAERPLDRLLTLRRRGQPP